MSSESDEMAFKLADKNWKPEKKPSGKARRFVLTGFDKDDKRIKDEEPTILDTWFEMSYPLSNPKALREFLNYLEEHRRSI